MQHNDEKQGLPKTRFEEAQAQQDETDKIKEDEIAAYNKKTPYEVLGINSEDIPTMDQETIKKKAKALRLTNHPDKVEKTLVAQAKASVRINFINNALDILTDQKKSHLRNQPMGGSQTREAQQAQSSAVHEESASAYQQPEYDYQKPEAPKPPEVNEQFAAKLRYLKEMEMQYTQAQGLGDRAKLTKEYLYSRYPTQDVFDNADKPFDTTTLEGVQQKIQELSALKKYISGDEKTGVVGMKVFISGDDFDRNRKSIISAAPQLRMNLLDEFVKIENALEPTINALEFLKKAFCRIEEVKSYTGTVAEDSKIDTVIKPLTIMGSYSKLIDDLTIAIAQVNAQKDMMPKRKDIWLIGGADRPNGLDKMIDKTIDELTIQLKKFEKLHSAEHTVFLEKVAPKELKNDIAIIKSLNDGIKNGIKDGVKDVKGIKVKGSFQKAEAWLAHEKLRKRMDGEWLENSELIKNGIAKLPDYKNAVDLKNDIIITCEAIKNEIKEDEKVAKELVEKLNNPKSPIQAYIKKLYKKLIELLVKFPDPNNEPDSVKRRSYFLEKINAEYLGYNSKNLEIKQSKTMGISWDALVNHKDTFPLPMKGLIERMIVVHKLADALKVNVDFPQLANVSSFMDALVCYEDNLKMHRSEVARAFPSFMVPQSAGAALHKEIEKLLEPFKSELAQKREKRKAELANDGKPTMTVTKR